ncbi:MAG: efflux RND transporter periplasmic adaptor subunit [Kiritimatiellales bacterium]|nr:efflux RND transporter periplasmic adaptor subunit [Kiritimatiellota bacterium]MBL7011688.1 efflux RND transporter periplasmic adaptor subunit [Kiritimatiellales bacterium]
MNKKAVFKTIGVLIAGAAIGWFVKGMIPAGGPPPGMGGMQMPPATVKILAVQETLLDTADEYIAAVEPMQEVILRPEVSGRIDQVNFTEGSFVKEGDLLFTIDRSAYQATADAAEAEMVRAKRRYERLQQADTRSVSASDLESAESDYLRGKAAFELAKVDLDYTEIKAPISGRIGSAMIKKGNYVTPVTVELARIVQTDPIRVVFSQTDRDYLALRRREIAGDATALEARVILPDGSVLTRPASQVPLETKSREAGAIATATERREVANIGKKDFDDNAINPMTGTIAVRYLFDNPDGLLLPGGYITVQLSNPAGETGIKIPLRSLLIDQDGAYVLTVDEVSEVGVIRVEAGDQIGPDVIIRSGLKPGDQVVIDGIQKARPGATVQVIPSEGAE